MPIRTAGGKPIELGVVVMEREAICLKLFSHFTRAAASRTVLDSRKQKPNQNCDDGDDD